MLVYLDSRPLESRPYMNYEQQKIENLKQFKKKKILDKCTIIIQLQTVLILLVQDTVIMHSHSNRPRSRPKYTTNA